MTLPNFLLEANPVGNPYPKVMKYTSSFSNNPRKRNQKFNKKPPIEFNLPKMKSTWANYTDHSPLVDQAKWWFRIREFSQKTPLVQVWELYADLPRYVAFKVIAQFPHLIFLAYKNACTLPWPAVRIGDSPTPLAALSPPPSVDDETTSLVPGAPKKSVRGRFVSDGFLLGVGGFFGGSWKDGR